MTQKEEVDRFFAGYSERDKELVEFRQEYHYALKKGKTTTALEIAAIAITDSLTLKEIERDIERIMKKEFPEISN
ncbi:MAG: hypothetical protein WDN00_03160 [Limisphaerales bacterium]